MSGLLMRILGDDGGSCVHDFTDDSTLRIKTISAVGQPQYLVECTVCGDATIFCCTKEEAMERARRGWMD